jgi:nitrous oxidase accessory protein
MTASTQSRTARTTYLTTRLSAVREVLAGSLTRPIVAILGSVLVAVAGFLPVWSTRLVAPQYPKGLELTFFADRIEGPVREVNGLNHYIGMQTIDLSVVPELGLWPLAVVAGVVLLVGGLFLAGWLGRLALIGLWLIPVVILLDIQRWLITFGTELDPRAALRLEGFVPLAVGSIQVWNFSVSALPGSALILIALVALTATFARRAEAPAPRTRNISAGVALSIGLVGTLLLVASPAAAGEADSHENGTEMSDEMVDEGMFDDIDLQALVDKAPPGTTLRIPAGTYRTHLVIDKPLELVADGEVYLDGGGIGSVITVTGDHVRVEGFEIANTGGQVEVGAGIKIVEANDVTVERTRMRDFFHGIASLGSTDVRIRDNVLIGSGGAALESDHLSTGAEEHHTQVVVDSDPRDLHAHATGTGPEGQGDGIYLWSTRSVTVARNTIENVRDGIYLSFVEDGLVDSNDVVGSRYAVHSMFGGPVTVFGNGAHENLAGLVFMYTEGVLAGRNIIEDQRSAATGVGVLLKDAEDVRIAENVIARNRIGLKVDGTHRTADKEAAVLRNRFDSNDTAVSLFPSADLGFGANTFENNLTDVHADDRGVARRNDWTYQGTGNLWSNYAGYDLDADGIGDVPHTASGALKLILADVPALQLYRDSPALRALDSAQELWEADRAVVMQDTAPRLDDHAPSISDLAPGDTRSASLAGDAPGWYAAGIVLALLAAIGAAVSRSRRRDAAR